MLWPGSGYCLDGPFPVSSDLLQRDNLEYAVELLAAYLTANNLTDYYMTPDEYESFCASIGYDTDCDDLEGWLYVDGTMEGAKFPIYLNIENMRAEFVS